MHQTFSGIYTLFADPLYYIYHNSWINILTCLIFLGKLEVVVGFEALQMICQIHNWDWRVASHACQSDRLQVTHRSCKGVGVINQAQSDSGSVDKQHVCLTGRNGRVALVRLVCSLKAGAMLIERIWTQKPMRSHRSHFWDSPYWERKTLFTKKAVVGG